MSFVDLAPDKVSTHKPNGEISNQLNAQIWNNIPLADLFATSSK